MLSQNPRQCHGVPRIAAPSWVIPGDISQNARFLTGKVDEIGLCLFETDASLAYTSLDLPPWLANLQVEWHAHLPLDLPWHQGASAVARICQSLHAKISFLRPHFLVLHPPVCHASSLLENFAAIWQNIATVPILLENTKECDLTSLNKEFFTSHAYGLCLDVGHALGYSQMNLMNSSLTENARLVHWSAPGSGDKHLPLTMLTGTQLAAARQLMTRVPPQGVHMLEIFQWQGIIDSLPILKDLLHAMKLPQVKKI